MVAWIMISYVVVTIFVLFALTFYLYWFSRNHDCQNNPNPWCWYDWTCLTAADDTSPRTYPAQTLYGCGKDANGVDYPTRNLDYCDPTKNGYSGVPPGCRCMPDADGFVDLTGDCAFSTGWNALDAGGSGQCAQKLANGKDGQPADLNLCQGDN